MDNNSSEDLQQDTYLTGYEPCNRTATANRNHDNSDDESDTEMYIRSRTKYRWAVDRINSYTPLVKWTEKEDASHWANVWIRCIENLAANENFKRRLRDRDVRVHLANKIVESITISVISQAKDMELQRDFVDNPSPNLKGLTDWLQLTSKLQTGSRDSKLVELLELRRAPLTYDRYLSSIYMQQLIVADLCLEFFKPFAPQGRPFNSGNLAEFFANHRRHRIMDQAEDGFKVRVKRRKMTKQQRDSNDRKREFPKKSDQVPNDKPTSSNSNSKDKPKFVVRCWECNETGHRRGDPACKAKAGTKDAANPVFLSEPDQVTTSSEERTGVVLKTGEVDKKPEIILDSGASVHIFAQERWFEDLKPCDKMVGTLNGELKVSAIGTVKLPLNTTSGEKVYWTLTNCLYVPGKINLVSKKALRRDKVFSSSLWEESDYDPVDESFFSFRLAPNDPYKILRLTLGRDNCDILPVDIDLLGKPPLVGATITGTTTDDLDNEIQGVALKEQFGRIFVGRTYNITSGDDVKEWHLRCNHALNLQLSRALELVWGTNSPRKVVGYSWASI